MAGNSIGTVFRVTTWGESHGAALGAVVDGCPPGIPLSVGDIQEQLDIRRPGDGAFSSSRREKDRVEILSGVFEGSTTGTPIALLIRNVDADPQAYDSLRDVFRPGHGDFTYDKKYSIRDYRGGGRASGRETAARVAAGTIARKVISRAGIVVRAYTVAVGTVTARRFAADEAVNNPLCCPDAGMVAEMETLLEACRREGDSIGGVVEVRVTGCPPGLGEPVFEKLDAALAGAIMSIGTIKGVEIGAGFTAAAMRGSECNDPIVPGGFVTNNAGGILAGISTGQEIVIRAACKPIPSIGKEQQTVDRAGRARRITIGGRHDVCVIPRILPVCEAMVSIVLADFLLRQQAVR